MTRQHATMVAEQFNIPGALAELPRSFSSTAAAVAFSCRCLCPYCLHNPSLYAGMQNMSADRLAGHRKVNPLMFIILLAHSIQQQLYATNVTPLQHLQSCPHVAEADYRFTSYILHVRRHLHQHSSAPVPL